MRIRIPGGAQALLQSIAVVPLLLSVLPERVASASAGDFEGRWSGPGVAEMNPGSPRPKKRLCSRIGLDLGQAADRLELRAGFYECEDLKAEYGTAGFQLRDGRVWLDGKDVGSFDGRVLDLTVTDPVDGVDFHLRLAAGGEGASPATDRPGRLDYLEEWTENGRVRLRVSGGLRRL